MIEPLMKKVAESYTRLEDPFPHVYVETAFRRADIDENVIKHLLSSENWIRQKGPAHLFWSYGEPLDEFAAIRGQLQQHRSFIQEYLSVSLEDNPALDLFRLSEGDGIGFHDDANVEAVRLVVSLHYNAIASTGGELLLTGGKRSNTYVYPLQDAHGVAFKTDLRAPHAIATVKGDPVLFLTAEYQIAAPS